MDEINPLKYELELFRDAVINDTIPIVSGSDGLAALDVAEKIMDSIRNNTAGSRT